MKRKGQAPGAPMKKFDGYTPPVGHGPLTPPCRCGLPLIRSDETCPRCGKATGR